MITVIISFFQNFLSFGDITNYLIRICALVLILIDMTQCHILSLTCIKCYEASRKVSAPSDYVVLGVLR